MDPIPAAVTHPEESFAPISDWSEIVVELLPRNLFHLHIRMSKHGRVWKGFTVLLAFSSPGDEIGFTILRYSWKPGTSGLYVRCTFVLYPTALRSEFAIFQGGYFFSIFLFF